MRTAVLVLLAAVAALGCAAPVQDDCSGPKNTHPIWEQSPTTVRTGKNARLTLAQAIPKYNELQVLHVYGSPYEMGFAQGSILRDNIIACMDAFQDYIDDMIAPYIKFLPKALQHAFEIGASQAALELEVLWTEKYVPKHFEDEIRGLADGLNSTKYPYETLLRIHMFPELIKASCSMFGAWGPAIANISDTLVQLRALDWGMDSPLNDYPLLVVYHPDAGNGHPFASLTWSGFVGSVTAYGSYMGVSEKVWLKYNETAAREGIPFHFLLRDIAQYDVTLDDAINRMVNNQRTCSIFAGIGSRVDNQFRVAMYGHEEVHFYDDKNYPAYSAHPLMDGLVYVDKHTQPSSDTCLGLELKENYGSLDAEHTIRNIIAPFGTGDLHAAVYDYGRNNLYIGVAGTPIDDSGNPQPGQPDAPAYSRPWFRFNMTELFALEPPSV